MRTTAGTPGRDVDTARAIALGRGQAGRGHGEQAAWPVPQAGKPPFDASALGSRTRPNVPAATPL
ncbi:hypothetical protein [Actinosynnema pretiosum]|uniref:hypothetical protein n=1 Tax=Actinosynnema pretiosum TaxID=42197 RepID=UPI0012FD0C96|nr:hypothetical protein [Actinosynnema pretiosum]